jgi:hypothetical protein
MFFHPSRREKGYEHTTILARLDGFNASCDICAGTTDRDAIFCESVERDIARFLLVCSTCQAGNIDERLRRRAAHFDGMAAQAHSIIGRVNVPSRQAYRDVQERARSETSICEGKASRTAKAQARAQDDVIIEGYHVMTKPTPQAVDPPTPITPAPDPFDLARLRLSPSFLETAGVKKLLTTVPARKPGPQDFVRVHSAPEYRENFAMIDLKEDREDFLVLPELLPELTGEVVYKTIFTAINRQGVVFLWPIRLPTPDDRKSDNWARSEREAAELAMGQWVRLKANMSLGAYEITVAENVMAEPEWPELPFQELVRIAYRDRMITNLEHAVVKRLRGQT